MREYKFRAAIRSSIGRRHLLTSDRLLGLAVAASPFLFATAVLAESSRVVSTNPVPIRELILAGVAIGVEIALFISIPIYLRSRRRKKIRSRIRVVYDSRLDRRSRIFRPAAGHRTVSGRSIGSPVPMRLRTGMSDELQE